MENEQKIQKTVHYHFNAPIGQYIEHVENNYFGHEPIDQQKLFPQLPSQEEMIQAVTATMTQGLWWSSRSWAVVYRVYQMKGYMKGFTQFAREVNEWDIDMVFECNYDAIQKPISSGIFSGMPDQWEQQGAQKQAVKLANALLEFLDNKLEDSKLEKKIS